MNAKGGTLKSPWPKIKQSKELGADKHEATKKKPGLWIEIKEGLWARVGRNAAENDELFKQARDRDLWFHVRAEAGAHVWIPYGQTEFKGKAPSEEILSLGAQLAIFNSKARGSRGAHVDITNRSQLKKISGQSGKLKILRSDVRFTRLDPLFERRVLGK